MRKIILALALFFVFCGLHAQTGTPKEITNFIEKFQKAVLTHNFDKVMVFMDKEYIETQCNEMLKKNKHQFIDEFFSGYKNIQTREGFTNTHLTEIKAIDLSGISPLSESEYEITFLITLTSGNKIYCRCWLKKFKGKLGFYGAVG
jgi:hypothetical protein